LPLGGGRRGHEFRGIQAVLGGTELSEQAVPPVEALEQIREIEQRAREAGAGIRQARDQMRLCAGEYEQADRRWSGEPWYTGGLADEAQRLGEIVAELDVLVMDLEERGW
jgi:hypothetical protein